MRRDRWAALVSRLVPVARATATAVYPDAGRDVGPRNVVDASVFESCDDFWLLPDGATGAATVEFVARAAVRRILVLNTGNREFGDRASRRVRVSAVRGGQTVRAADVDLAPFPDWTTVDLRASDVDAIRVDVLSFVGKGGGLNEIKVFGE